MDSLISFAKDNFEIITLLFGLLSVIIAVFSLIHEINVKKRKKAKKKESSVEEIQANDAEK